MRRKLSSAVRALAESFRPLKSDELVQRGDFVEDGRHGFEPWDGPGGFRADSFVKRIYRRQGRPMDASGHSS
jgi:hypothetical protein